MKTAARSWTQKPAAAIGIRSAMDGSRSKRPDRVTAASAWGFT